MSELSIVVKANDKYSEATKKMTEITKAFSKNVDELEKDG